MIRSEFGKGKNNGTILARVALIEEDNFADGSLVTPTSGHHGKLAPQFFLEDPLF